jgi:hypothetical protein
MVDIKSEEILTYLLLIVVGYCIAKMFSKRCNGFSVGGQPRQIQPTIDYCIVNTSQGLVNLGNANISEYNSYCSNNGCYYSNKNDEHTCKSCENIDLSNIESMNKDIYCSGTWMTGGSCHYDSTSDICVSNYNREPPVLTCKNFNSESCPRGKQVYTENLCKFDECTTDDCCLDSAFHNENGTCEPRSDVSFSESVSVPCSNFRNVGNCVGRMGPLYNRFDEDDNALHQCQWSNSYGTSNGTFEDWEIIDELFPHGH